MVEVGFYWQGCESFYELASGAADYDPHMGLFSHTKVATYEIHQQQCKNHVQLVVLTTSNNIQEGFHSD